MILLLLSSLGFACSEVQGSELRILLAEDEAVHPMTRFAVQLGDMQMGDPDTEVLLLDGDGLEVPFTTEEAYHATGSDERLLTRRITPTRPLVPGGSYTLLAEAPQSELSDAVDFTVGDDEDRDLPPSPQVTFRRHEDILFEDGETNPCVSEHRLIELTVDPQGFSDELTLVHVWDQLRAPDPDFEGFGHILVTTNGNPTTLQFATGLEDERTCVSVLLEDALGRRSEPTELCYDGPLDDLDAEDPEAGCACSASPGSPALVLALAPLLLGLLRRRSR